MPCFWNVAAPIIGKVYCTWVFLAHSVLSSDEDILNCIKKVFKPQKGHKTITKYTVKCIPIPMVKNNERFLASLYY